MTKEDYIHKYFLNGLTQEELEVFTKFLKEDKDFQEEFEFQKKLQRVIKSEKRNELITKAAKLESKIMALDVSNKQVDHSRSKKTRKVGDSNKLKRESTFWKLGIAASIAVFISVGIYFFNKKPNTNQLFSDYYDRYPNTVYPITMDDQNVNSLELKAFQAYEVGEYEKAISYFIQVKEKNKPTYADFYLGNSYLSSNQIEKAIKTFEIAIDSEKQFYLESRWYLALALIKNNNISKAREQLRKIINSGSYKKDEARILLKKIN